MKPSQVSAYLRQIASKIDRSRRPDKSLVVRDLRKLVARVAAEPSGVPGGGGDGMVQAIVLMDGLEENMGQTNSAEKWEDSIGKLAQAIRDHGWEVSGQEGERITVMLPQGDVPQLQELLNEVAATDTSFNPEYMGVSLSIEG